MRYEIVGHKEARFNWDNDYSDYGGHGNIDFVKMFRVKFYSEMKIGLLKKFSGTKLERDLSSIVN